MTPLVADAIAIILLLPTHLVVVDAIAAQLVFLIAVVAVVVAVVLVLQTGLQLY